MFEMTQETKKKASNFGVAFYRVLSLLGIFTLVFNLGIYKKDIDSRTFESAEERFSFKSLINYNTKHRLDNKLHMTKVVKDSIYVQKKEFNKVVEEILTAIKINGNKIDNLK